VKLSRHILRDGYAFIAIAVGVVAIIMSRNRSTFETLSRLSIPSGTSAPEILFPNRGADRLTPISSPGKPHVLYVFLTTCPICTAQRSHVAEALAGIGGDTLLTISPEPPALIEKYWSGTRLQSQIPVSVSISTLKRIRVVTVPTLVFLNSEGIIIEAFGGLMQNIRTDEIREHVRQ
jgi:peroxiredoxin